MPEERLFVVAYDIADRRRWRRVLMIVEGYGDRLQLSVFQCRLTSRRRVELAARLEEVIRKDQDSVLFLDLGPADKVTPRVESLGSPSRPSSGGHASSEVDIGGWACRRRASAAAGPFFRGALAIG